VVVNETLLVCPGFGGAGILDRYAATERRAAWADELVREDAAIRRSFDDG